MTDGSTRAHIVRWGDLAWRLLAIGAVVFFAFRILKTVSVVVLAAVFALFIAAVLWRPNLWLRRHGFPPALAAMSCILLALLALGAAFAFLVPQLVSGLDDFATDLATAWESVQRWLIEGPLGLSQGEIDDYVADLVERLQAFGGESLLGGAVALVEFVTGTILALVVTFFILKDGRALLEKASFRLGTNTAAKTVGALRVGRQALAQYIGGIAIIGLFDAILIGVALWLVGAPLVLPLALLVFLGAFIPLVGAFASGLLAVAVTLVNVGVTQGLIILAVVVAVQQFEGDVIMPLVFGSTLRIHPLLVLLAVAVGGIAFGLPGAFLSVPLVATAVSIHEELSDDPESAYLSLARG